MRRSAADRRRQDEGATLELAPPDLSAWQSGNRGVPYVWTFEAAAAGPHVGLCALVHGNEFSGALALLRLVELGLRPARGRLTLIFANPEALAAFDPRDPWASRFLDEDLNRLWSAAELDAPRRTRELARARELRPIVDELDALLDLHSMHAPGPPLLLCAPVARARALAARMGFPGLVISCPGHESGARLIDYPRFVTGRDGPVALLLEAGRHWSRHSVEVAVAATLAFLDALGVLEPELAARIVPRRRAAQRFVDITHTVTVRHAPFVFHRELRSFAVVEEEGTVIASDGGEPVRTPYPRCALVLPGRRFAPGTTAVRLGRFAAAP